MIELNFRATPLLKSHKQLNCTNYAQISEIWCKINYSVVAPISNNIHHVKGSFNYHVDRKRGEGVNQMSMIVHVREGGGLKDVHVDKS